MISKLSLAAKLYSIFGLFALLTAAITALSDYNTRRNTELTEAVATASRAALNPERSKRLAQTTDENHTLAFILTALGAFALLVVVAGVLIIARSIARPLSAITGTIKRVADGEDNVEVPHTARGDEIGALARAIQI